MSTRIRHIADVIGALAAGAVVCAGIADAADPSLTAGQESTVTLAPSGETMKVYMPSNYSADRKWPAIFFYHGMGGSPDTALMRGYADGRDYIVVGMPYVEEDSRPKTAREQDAYSQRELSNFHTARNWLTAHANVDETRIFMAGVSKGGWTVGALGELELPRLGGLIILLAGRQSGSKPALSLPAVQNKPIYVGAGEKDPNMMPARRAAEFYKRNGAIVTFEEYAGLGHEVPPDASRLRAWLQANGRYRQAATAQAARKELAAELEERFKAVAAETNAPAKYERLLDLARDPRLRLCDQALPERVRNEFAMLIRSSPPLEEWTAETTFNDLLYRESVIRRLADMESVLEGFQTLAQAYPQTRYGKLALQYAPSLAEAYRKSVEATRRANEGQTTGGTTNIVHSVKPAFPPVRSGGGSMPVPVRKGNKIIFGKSGDK